MRYFVRSDMPSVVEVDKSHVAQCVALEVIIMAVFYGFLAAAARPTGIAFGLSSQFQAAAQNDTPKLAPVVLVPGT